MNPDPINDLFDLMARAIEAENALPLVYAPKAIADEWALVPRKHLRRLAELGTKEGDPTEEDLAEVMMLCAGFVADARLLGVSQ